MNCQKVSVFILTFLAYTLMHSGRTLWSYVTKPLWDLNIPDFNKTSTGYVNLSFQLFYAIALYLGEPLTQVMPLSSFIGWGAFLSGAFVFLIGGFGYLNIINIYYIFIFKSLNGFFESTVLPGSIGLLSQYFTQNTGFIFGLWCGCKNFGDVLGLYFGQFTMEYGNLSAYDVLVIQGTGSMLIGLMCVIFLKEFHQVNYALQDSESTLVESSRVNWTDALKIKVLLIYVCIQSLLKSIVYGLLFWLPSYIQSQNNPSLHNESGLISSMNYYGSFIGGVILGALTDRFQKKSSFQFIFLLLVTGIFIAFEFVPSTPVPYYIFIFLIGLFMGGVFNNISGVLAVNLGKLPQFKSNKKAVKSLSSIIECISSFICALFQGIIGEIPFKVLFPLFGGMTGLCLIFLGMLLPEEWRKKEKIINTAETLLKNQK